MTGARSKAAKKNTGEALKPADDRKIGKRKAAVDKSTIRRAKKEKRAKKDPNKPKRPPSAFFVFLEEFRGTFKKENPNVKAVSAVGKAAGEMWKSMSEEEKAPYEVKSGQRKVEYEKQMKAYNKKQENSANGIGDDHEVDALQAIRRKLKDPRKNLRNWRKGDPCVSNWTGVICTMPQPDGFLHIQELRMLNLNLTGKLAPELGQLSNLTVLNFMWNHNITGSIPKEIGNIKSLKFLLLSGNQLSGPLADELGFLPNLFMFQVDLNQITGSLPKSFVNLISCRHFHMNNNSISGQIPSELSSMPALIHFLLDNNNLMGNLPPEFSQMPKLRILQLDNNNFGGTEIPASYGNISNLVKFIVHGH